MQKFMKLFEPGRIGKMELKNRIIFAPLINFYPTIDGHVSERTIAYYVQRGQGGVGLIVTEGLYPRRGGYMGRLHVWHDKFIPGLKRLSDAIHKTGTKVVCQLNTHRGRADEHDPAAPSAILHPFTKVMAREISVAEIRKLVEEFGEGVRRVREAGFDGVMIHNCTGYLVQEFLSPETNKRTDEYGGDLQGRAKFALELAEVTRKNLGPDYPIIVRLGADDRTGKGFRVNEAIELCKIYERMGIDMIDVTTGSAEAHWYVAPFMFMPPACNVDIAELIKKEINIPVGVAGKIVDPYIAEEILKQEKVDFICIGRGLIADPQWPNKVKEERVEDIRRCLTCSKCWEDVLVTHTPIECTVNPVAGKEREFDSKLERVTRKKKVLVIGGGPAGLQAAIIAAQKGHNVTLWEKTGKLGGQLNIAVIPPGKKDIIGIIRYLRREIKKATVTIELRKEATSEEVEKFAPDAVIVAIGSSTRIPDIPGVKNKNVITCREVLTRKREAGNKIVVMGGGYVGCDTCFYLTKKGKDVTLVTTSPEPALDIKSWSFRALYLQKLEEEKVKVVAGVKKFNEITPKGLRLIDKEGTEVLLEADNIVLATGAVPLRALTEKLKRKFLQFYEVGDCVEVGRIKEAIHGGAWAALEI